MLNDVKTALRINNDSFNREINNLINACKMELELVGIASSKINSGDYLVNLAIINYVKANFGFDNPDSQKQFESYEKIKTFLSTNNDYKEVS